MDRDNHKPPLIPLASRGKGMLAVDVVLIPTREIVRLAVEMNRSLPESAQEDYLLDAKTCVPHISLLMGLVLRDQLGEVSRKLNNVAKKFSSLKLHATGFVASPHPDGKMFSSLVVEKSPNLQKLHETVLKELKPLFSWDGVEKEMFYSPPTVKEISSFWVQGFIKNSVQEKYKPHVSLGFGELKKGFRPVQFIASKLALCHLGNYCTCRDILSSFPLKVRGTEGVTQP